ncbi:MAG: hypothetical protein ATN33_06580 [Epulopiscium sp. Nele67-Bin001]|nr:MAG: hypothetical protein BEN18_06120 [Epulopiscium sp. Nuni2H_MBin001]OON92780.1 MAG: hypothetical protein ATN33_06580 [Epulopiscium sp. Nele67-Bin001]
MKFLLIILTLVSIPSVVVFSTGASSTLPLTTVAKATTNDIEMEQQIIGILAQIVPYTSHIEHLKVNAVIARTYITNGMRDLLPLSQDVLKELWQDNYQNIYTIYKEAIDLTADEIIYYDNSPIEPIFHQTSPGVTRDGAQVYGSEIPYLKSVDASVDNVIEETSFEIQSFIDTLKLHYPGIYISLEYFDKQIQIVQTVDGYINQIQFGSIILDENDLLSIFNLPTSNATITTTDTHIIFTTNGVGDGVGLSQNASAIYAQEGSDYKSIIEHFYTGVTVY